ncbi:MAG TPA: ABC-type transport auxiliary lipoprotein family protein, partial [Burkholderiaceae bacterium]|nr:ABC-type transport auxiliary lipoprotein family protein [Burkholderiaceae bacterium]
MNDRSRRRQLLRGGLALPLAAGLAVLSGCFGGAGQPHVLWELQPDGGWKAGDAMQPMRVSAPADARRASLSLVVEGIAAGELYDGTALVYSRSAGMRAHYQHASWTERPALRVARLVQQSLQQRGGFRDVTLADSGVAPDLMLTLTLVEMYHDVPANELRVELGAALVD